LIGDQLSVIYVEAKLCIRDEKIEGKKKQKADSNFSENFEYF
jgi:hypothetical protein